MAQKGGVLREPNVDSRNDRRELEEIGRGKRIRTSGPCLPKTVLYQAELFPDRCGFGANAEWQAAAISV
jgi:hypothetical protein